MENDYRANFGLMIPVGPLQYPPESERQKRPWLCKIIGHRWKTYMVTTRDRMPHKCERCKKITYVQWPFQLQRFLWECLDIIFRPLCYLGWHRWKGTFRSETWSYFDGKGPKEIEEHYRCARCSNKKTVKIR